MIVRRDYPKFKESDSIVDIKNAERPQSGQNEANVTLVCDSVNIVQRNRITVVLKIKK